MITDQLKKELSKIPVEELLRFYEEEKQKSKIESEKRYTLGKLDAIVDVSSTNQKRYVIEYSIKVPEGILCYVKTGSKETVEKLIKEINDIINKFQK